MPLMGPSRNTVTAWLSVASSTWWQSIPIQVYGLEKCPQNMRWQIEQDPQQFKEEPGLDHFEGRKSDGWHRHVTLTTNAFAFLLLERLRG